MINEIYLKKRKLLFLFSIFLIVIIATSTISLASAADITIDPNTSGGLKEAVKIANDGDTISLKDGVYTGENNTKIAISKSVNIKGVGSNVVLDGEGKNQIFNIKGEKVLLKKLKFRNGYKVSNYNGAGAIYHEKGNLNIADCIFTNNEAKNNMGGAIDSSYRGTLSVSSSTFKNNKADFGGAINSFKSIIRKCTFKNNQVKEEGGAICTLRSTISSCTFNNNYAKGKGGAIFAADEPTTNGNLTVISSTFNNNQAKEEGGAICAWSISTSTVKSCTFKNNNGKSGGAIHFHGGTMSIKKCTFKNNQAKSKGGAIECEYGSLDVSSCTFNNNQVKSKGGAIVLEILMVFLLCQ